MCPLPKELSDWEQKNCKSHIPLLVKHSKDLWFSYTLSESEVEIEAQAGLL
jgi:hypothetical protein